MRKVICLFCKLRISLNLITCALIDHNAWAIYIWGCSQATFAPKGQGGFTNINFTFLDLLSKYVNQQEVEDKKEKDCINIVCDYP